MITVDAKQRHLVLVPSTPTSPTFGSGSSPPSPSPSAVGGWTVCAEAAPDVFSAASTSAGADLGFGQGGSSAEARAKAALAIAEAAGTIERTQTINLFRESMYRTCERYLSGAIDRATFLVQAGRDWRAMIAVLAIEQLTRAARPPATIIAAGTTSATVEGSSDAIRQLIIAQGAEEEARTKKTQADAALAAGNCAEITDDNRATCAPLKQATDDAGAALARATQRRETWEAVAKSAPALDRTGSTTGVPPSDDASPTQPGAPPGDIAKVASTIGYIVREAFRTDETQLFCLQILHEGKLSRELQNRCTIYLMDKVEAERRSLFNDPAVVTRAIEIDDTMRSARQEMALHIRGLSPEAYEAERQRIATALGFPFCAGLSSDQCVAAVLDSHINTNAAEALKLLGR